jgi:hypothetical protein
VMHAPRLYLLRQRVHPWQSHFVCRVTPHARQSWQEVRR